VKIEFQPSLQGAVGDKDAAFELLERACEERDGTLINRIAQ
jgi:hypothetical protein